MRPLPPHATRRIALAATLVLALACAACTAPGPGQPYPPPESLELAPVKRQEFVASFLQGRWCEAKDLLAQSVEDSLRRDDPCAAAYSHLTLWRLKAYVGIEDEQARREAMRLRDIGMGCPGSERLAVLDGGPLPPRDRRYRELIAAGDDAALMDALAAEPDALYASVYARKAARKALDDGRPDLARPYLALARALDGDRGWVVFLREDWKMESEATDNPDDRSRIAQRIAILDALVDPCP